MMARGGRSHAGWFLAAAIAAVLVLRPGTGAAAQQGGATKPPAQAAPKPPGGKLAKLAEPWPEDEVVQKRRVDAETLPLFATHEPLALTLTADFKAVNRERTPDSLKRFPGTLTVTGADGQPVQIPVKLGTRGNLRLNIRVCSFAPLVVEFPKREAKGTPFERQGALKLVTHCQTYDSFEQRVIAEHLVYRAFTLMTPAAFRTRLARITYVNVKDGKDLGTRWAIFIEDQDDLAKRMESRIAPLKGRGFAQLDRTALLRVAVFQFMIGNTDWSIIALHNTRLIHDRAAVLRPIIYDFDVSGLVNPPYGVPFKQLPITSIRERLYRGPCLPLEMFEPTLEEFRAKQVDILGLYDAQEELKPGVRRESKDYLGEFFEIITNQGRTKRFFVDNCQKANGM
jgi:hypothetical protein